MSHRLSKFWILGLTLCLLLLIPAASFAAGPAPIVLTVPYAYGSGGAVIPHPTYMAGYSAGPPPTCTTTKAIKLKGTIIDNGTGSYTYSWDFGDGSTAASGSVGNVNAIEASHAYCGYDGQVFTATLTVTNNGGNGNSGTSQYTIQIFDLATASNNGTDLKASVAIDEGLWYLHKTVNRGTCTGSIPCAWWNSQGFYVAETSAKTQAFFSAGHTETPQAMCSGVPCDPYVTDVQNTMHWLFNYLDRDTFGAPYDVGGANPDGTGPNGMGIHTNEPGYDGNQFVGYEHGLFLSNLIASGNPSRVTVTGNAYVIGRTYKAIAQDMLDEASYCQYQDSRYGAWRYTCRQFPDNSPSGWIGIGIISAVRQWGLTVPANVYTMNQGWLAYSQVGSSANPTPCETSGYSGGTGYFTYSGSEWSHCNSTNWGPYAVTSSGMVELVMDSIPRTDPRWVAVESWQRDYWDNPSNWPNYGPMRTKYYYALLSFVKAMELQIPAITMLHSSTSALPDLDWYYDASKGVAPALISAQYTDGSWNNVSHNFSGQQDQFNTAWAIEMLNQTVIQTGKPVAVAKVNNPGVVGESMQFDGSASYDQDASKTITQYDWLISKVAGPIACGTLVAGPNVDSRSGQFPTDTFSALGQYVAQLTVTDSAGQTAFGCVNVNITVPPVPPTANAGGPYTFCNQVTPWTLNGSASTSATLGQTEPNCPTCTPNYLTSYNWNIYSSPATFSDLVTPNATVDATAALQHLAIPGTYTIGLTVTDDTSQAFPSSGKGNLTSQPAYATVILKGDCACISTLKANVLLARIFLSWQATTANLGYNIYRSTVNPATCATTPSTPGCFGTTPLATVPAGTTSYTDRTVARTTQYWYEVKPVDSGHTPNEWCTSNVVPAKSF